MTPSLLYITYISCMLLAARVQFCTAYRLPPPRITPIFRRSCSMATAESLNQDIAQQTTLLNNLRLQNAEASAVEEAKKKLGELKKNLGALTKAAGGGKDAKRKERLLLKTAKVGFWTFHHLLIKSHVGFYPITGYSGLWSR